MNAKTLWQRFLDCRCEVPSLELTLDISRMMFDAEFLTRMEPPMQQAYTAMDDLEKGAIGPGSKLDDRARTESWLARFPMWDWVGGRTSETSVVGLLPAALQGIDIDALLAGAAACDQVTRSHDTRSNPSALIALMWYHATGGKGRKNLVVLPGRARVAEPGTPATAKFSK